MALAFFDIVEYLMPVRIFSDASAAMIAVRPGFSARLNRMASTAGVHFSWLCEWATGHEVHFEAMQHSTFSRNVGKLHQRGQKRLPEDYLILTFGYPSLS